MKKIKQFLSLLPLAALLAMGHSDTLYGQQYTVQPGTLTFQAISGGAAPSPQQITVSAGGAFNVSVSYIGANVGWLTVTPPNGSSPPNVVLTASVITNLPPGQYTASIALTGSSFTTIQVTYTVTAGVSISANPSSLFFNYQIGGAVPSSKEITINSNGAPVPVSITTSVSTQVNWLAVTPTTLTTGNKITVSITNAGQLSPGPYTGLITVNSTGATNSPITIPIQLNVSTNPIITPSQESVNFYFQTGGTVPPAETVSFTSTGSPAVYFVTQTNNTPWLIVSPSNSATDTPLSISISPLSLAVGTYNATVTLSMTGAANPTIVIPISLTVSNQPLINVFPSTLAFNFQSGTGAPATKSLTVTSTGTPTNYTTGVSTTSGGAWLTATPNNGTTSAQITVGVDAAVAAALAPGTYSGKVTVTAPTAGNSPREIPVTLVVNNNPLLTAFPAELNFAFQVGKTLPSTQTFRIGSTGSPFNFSAVVEGAAWLTVSPANGQTGTNLIASANPGALSPGTFQGKIRITADGAGNSPLEIPVTFVISTTPLLLVSPAAVEFSVQVGAGSVQQQTAVVTSTDSTVALNFTTIASTNSGGGWLATTQNGPTTPTQLNVLALPAGLQVGTYTGQISVSSGGVNNSPQKIAATLRVTPNASIAAAPAAVTFNQTAGGSVPSSQTIQVTTSPASNVPFTISSATTTGGAWLSVAPTGTVTSPSTLTVGVNANQLPAGTYSGSITLASVQVSNSPLTIPVTLIVGENRSIIVNPGQLNFSWQIGASHPAPQTLGISLTQGTGSVQASIQATGSWLNVTPTSGPLPANLSVTVIPNGLTPGTYNGKIILTVAGTINSPLEVPVVLTVTGNTCSASPLALSFTQQFGSSAPGPQNIQVSCGVPTTFTAAVSPGTAWLTLSPFQSGTTIPVNVNGSALSPGQYTGTITINPTGLPAIVVTVTINVTTPPVNPAIGAVVNAASQQSSDLSPGLIVTIYGVDLGPTTPAGLTIENGFVTTTAGGARVFFDGVAAPMLYASRTQVNTIVPYGVGNRTTTRIQVEYGGVRSQAQEYRVSPSSPAIFTQNSAGFGPGAILNQDYAVNGVARPAQRGHAIQIYATGEGLTTPAGVDGQIILTAAQLRKPNLPVTATVGGVDAVVEYSGSAPSLVAGAFQVNVRIPENAPVGTQPVVIRVGGVQTQIGVTVQIN